MVTKWERKKRRRERKIIKKKSGKVKECVVATFGEN
jgi:hypothetical protein